ncbi:MAG: ATP-dependent Clp protease proteolytic subunit [Candidatus Riflebacteria bacterium]|nr:ATP-dependent Clp protease proteolytic subunit [Candidatus Riflebacteria bacterium]
MKKNIFARTRLDDEDDEPIEEERERPTELSEIIEQKLLENRQIFLWGAVEDESAQDIVSKLLYLETLNPGEPITLFISSPGGVVTSGMAIIDTMNLISSPVSTVCMGLAASMGSLILSAGEKGQRYIFPYGRVMIHQPSVEYLYGQASDLEIQAREIVKTKEISAEILGKNCGKSKDKVLKDLDRDYWMDSKESIEYGIVDGIYKLPQKK